ncbi:MAG: hypothetical protein R2880_04210 [Deinococcales bacterium]
MSVASAWREVCSPTSAVRNVSPPLTPVVVWDFTCRNIETVLKDLSLINGKPTQYWSICRGWRWCGMVPRKSKIVKAITTSSWQRAPQPQPHTI